MQACTCSTPSSTAARLLATATSASLWQWMPERHAGKRRLHDLDGLAAAAEVSVPPLVSQSTRPSTPALTGGAQAGERVVRVGGEAVEEVLGVEEDALALRLEEAHRVGEHRQVLFQAGLEDLAHLQVAGLADDRHVLGAGGDEGVERGVVRGVAAGAARGAEGYELGVAA